MGQPQSSAGSATEIEAQMRELIDREAIRDLARRYAHLVWRCDVSSIVALFTEDGRMDTPDLPTLTGHKEINDSYEKIFAGMELWPFVHNHVVELDGDSATGTVYLDLRSRQDGRDIMAAGYYADTYRRVDGRWLFAHRDLTLVSFRTLGSRKTKDNTTQEA
jgi:ketosteroid isomerase-like protein